MKPYAYDVLFVENVSEEQYKEVLIAGRNNLKVSSKKLLTLSYVLAIANAVLAVVVYFAVVIYQTTVSSTSLGQSLLLAFMYAGPLIAGVAISTPLVCIANIQQKKFAEGK